MFHDYELRRYEKWLRRFSDSSVDYSYKSQVISNYVPEFLNSVLKTEHCYSSRDLSVDYSMRDYLYDTFGFCQVLESYRINNAYSHRVSRLRKRISRLLLSPCYFVTFTFNDSKLESTTEKFRRIAVQRYLKAYTNDYVANIDYGAQNHREHYHAVVNFKNLLPPNELLWKYGYIHFEKVRLRSKTDVLLSKYVSKLTNHAIKNTTKRVSLIYPKNKNFS